jgi:ABC-2 type transport system ATP-binding protein
MNDTAVIAVDGLHKIYRDGLFRRRKIEALKGVSLEVHRGEIFGLLGPNGAGKTTLIKILLGIVRKTKGEARMLGRNAGDRSARKRVGFLPENHRIPRHLTGNSAMEYYGGLSGMSLSEIRKKRPQMLETVGLTDWGKTSVKKYSKGMLQRLGLAQAMLHEPDLLILDEPTDGVDPVGRKEIREVLIQLKQQGKTVFLNSHLLQELELVCDRVAILVKGEVRKVGGVSEITDEAAEGSDLEIILHLESEETAIRDALGSQEPTSWRAVGKNRFHVGVAIQDQNQVNVLIDALRSGNVSIYSMSRRKMTLEDAFLDIVQEESPNS